MSPVGKHQRIRKQIAHTCTIPETLQRRIKVMGRKSREEVKKAWEIHLFVYLTSLRGGGVEDNALCCLSFWNGERIPVNLHSSRVGVGSDTKDGPTFKGTHVTERIIFLSFLIWESERERERASLSESFKTASLCVSRPVWIFPTPSHKPLWEDGYLSCL